MSTPDLGNAKPLTVREAARQRIPLDGADVQALEGALSTTERERDALRVALEKISAIRDSIVGVQGFNWSEHMYPLVAVLTEAGYEGVGYEVARENVGTLIERTNKAEARVQQLETALGEIAALGERCEDCEPTEAPFATHVTHHPIHGLPLFLCPAHAQEAREGTGWDRPLEVEDHEQDTAVTLAAAALRVGEDSR